MAKKQIPLIGRIQEKIATGTGSDRQGTRDTEPRRQQDLRVRSHTDWLLDRIRRTAAQFLSLARHGGLESENSDASDGDERRQRALMLAYKLALTAWRRREEATEREVLRAVRSQMIRELDDTESQRLDPSDPTLPAHGSSNPDANDRLAQRFRRTLLDPADADISASIIRFEAGLPGPLTPFYGDLAPTFGGPCPTDALANRYGKIVRHLYETVEQKLDERDRAAAIAQRMTRYAGAGK